MFKKKKSFFDLFKKNNNTIDNYSVIEEKDRSEKNSNKKDSFLENIKNIENEETKLLKIQKQYRSGEIKEEELTEEQVKSLSEVYDKKLANLRKSNEIRKQKLLEYRKKLQTDN